VTTNAFFLRFNRHYMPRLHVLSGVLLLVATAMMILVTACAGPKRPVLYPNEHLKTVGQETAKKDIDACIRLSVDAGLETEKGKDTAGKAVKGGAAGAIIGGAIGLVTGSVGKSAAIGAAGGAAAGAVHGASNRDLDPVQQKFVEQCLRDRGYQPIGWK